MCGLRQMHSCYGRELLAAATRRRSAQLASWPCERHIAYCEASYVSSPDRQCKAQLVQDAATNGDYAVVECNDWHYPPYRDWHAVILNGSHCPMAVRWIGNHSLEVSVAAAADIRNDQPEIRGRSYSVQISLHKVPDGDAALTGCGLDP